MEDNRNTNEIGEYQNNGYSNNGYSNNGYANNGYQNGSYQNGSYQSGSNYYQNTTQQYQTPNNHKKEKKPKKPHKFLKLVASAVVFGLIAGVVFQGVNIAAGHLLGSNQAAEEISDTATIDSTETSSSVSTTSGHATDVSTVAEECMPSIVSITNMGVQEVMSFFGTMSQEVTSAGSGIIVGENDTELLIATNNHVVEDSETLTVTFVDNSSVAAQIKGTDEDNDVAVIAVKLADISEETLNVIKTATLGDSDELLVGETAIAIGNALGYGQSVTAGIISATDRTFDDDSLSGTYIQTDAAINPGNSGGALLNASGEVIGINVAKESSSSVDSMGYAIPISYAKPILDELMNRETREIVDEDEQGALGIYGAAVDSSTYNMPEGVYVTDLVSGGAAEKAGLQKGDIITEFEGISISSMDGLKGQLKYYKTGETVTVTIQRIGNGGDYEEQEIDVLLQSASELTSESDSNSSGQNSGSGNSGSGNSGNGSGNNGSGSGGSGFGNLFGW